MTTKRVLATAAVVLLCTLAVGCPNTSRVEPQTTSPAQAGKQRIRLLPSMGNVSYVKFQRLISKAAKEDVSTTEYPLYCTQRNDGVILLLFAYSDEGSQIPLQIISETTASQYRQTHRRFFEPGTYGFPFHPAAFFLVPVSEPAVQPTLVKGVQNETERIGFFPQRILRYTTYVCKDDFDLREIAASGGLLRTPFTSDCTLPAEVFELSVDPRLAPGTYYLALARLKWCAGLDNTVTTCPYVLIEVT